MIAEAIAKIEQLAKQASSTEFLVAPGGPAPDRFVRIGEQLIHFKMQREANWEVTDLPTFMAISDGFDAPKNVCIWIKQLCPGDQHATVRMLDLTEKRCPLTLQLPVNPAFCALANFEKARPKLDQKALISVIRFDFSQVTELQNLVPLLRSVRWSNAQAANADIRANVETLGRSVELAVNTVEQIPETLAIQINPLCRPFTLTMQLVIDVDIAGQRIGFWPPSGETQLACEATTLALLEHLDREQKHPVYIGTPAYGLVGCDHTSIMAIK